MNFVDATIEVMSVPKESIPKQEERISREIWGVAGAYVLLGPPEDVGAMVRARPGCGGDVLNRVQQHVSESPWFTRAVLARDTRQGWNSAEAGFVEGRLHDMCRQSPGIDHTFRRDHDQTLQNHEEDQLERRYIPAIVASLRLVGVPIEMRAP